MILFIGFYSDLNFLLKNTRVCHKIMIQTKSCMVILHSTIDRKVSRSPVVLDLNPILIKIWEISMTTDYNISYSEGCKNKFRKLANFFFAIVLCL